VARDAGEIPYVEAGDHAMLDANTTGAMILRGVLLASLVMLQRGGTQLTAADQDKEELWAALPAFANSMPT
jgi:hypothetical protein